MPGRADRARRGDAGWCPRHWRRPCPCDMSVNATHSTARRCHRPLRGSRHRWCDEERSGADTGALAGSIFQCARCPARNNAANPTLAVARDTISRRMLIVYSPRECQCHWSSRGSTYEVGYCTDSATPLGRCRPGDTAKAAHRDSVLHHSPVDGDVRARDRRGPVSGEPCDDFGDFHGS